MSSGDAYGVFYAGDAQPVGVAEFLDRDTGAGPQRIFHHTFVGEDFGGRGLAGLLVAAALDDARAAGREVVPMCSFVARWIAKNNWSGAVATVTDEVEEWVADQG
ncbi:hypothetical protein A606_03855 [Corynebacterium terpenotabidum Y-11]|uniref:N-acetyltransferase domain-containing protein n=1 Tax=Corynebacterium terpenotabidum Y-11 TaxID=1200352 RepID=S4XFL6_9CORY|nr:hypothetical protein A606_03855 [Corynebacterium terpenotabidum Y-11]